MIKPEYYKKMKHNFKKLKIWQEGLALVIETYKMTKNFPSEEKYGLSSQLNRCAVSIPSNIAEGTQKYQQTFQDFS